MKQILLILVILGGIALGGYYAMNGRMPWSTGSPEEVQVAALRADYNVVREQWKQAGRATIGGMDTSSITDTPLLKLEQLEKNLAELERTLKTPEAKSQAAILRKELSDFKRTMR